MTDPPPPPPRVVWKVLLVGGNNSQICGLGVKLKLYGQKLYMYPYYVTLRFKGNKKNKLMVG